MGNAKKALQMSRQFGLNLPSWSMLLGVLIMVTLSFSVSPSHPEMQPGVDRLSFVSEECSIDNRAFQPGEILTYRIYYNWNFLWLSAGEVSFSVIPDGESLKLVADGRTYKVHEWLFKVRDKFECEIDAKSLRPISSTKMIQEGKYRLFEKNHYNFGAQQAISERGKTRTETEKDTIEFEGCVQDLLSVLYVARNLNYQSMNPGDAFDVSLFLDRELYPVSVKFLGKETGVKIRKQGKYDAICLSPETQSGRVFKDGDQMKIWVTDDENFVPLMVESPIAVGSIKAVLIGAKNLRHSTSLTFSD